MSYLNGLKIGERETKKTDVKGEPGIKINDEEGTST